MLVRNAKLAQVFLQWEECDIPDLTMPTSLGDNAL